MKPRVSKYGSYWTIRIGFILFPYRYNDRAHAIRDALCWSKAFRAIKKEMTLKRRSS